MSARRVAAARRNMSGIVWCLLVSIGGGCDRSHTEPPGSRASARNQDSGSPRPADLPDVMNPWTWPRARDATDHEKAIEDIGPYEPVDRRDPTSVLVNTNAHYWSALVEVAWDRDVDIDFDDEPVDLNGDGKIDTRLTRHVHARGGILANPALFGLTTTPDDPRGRRGRISVSTGVLGVREALRSDGTASGEKGMTCWLCHGGRKPADGTVVLGLAPVAFDYGLLLATSKLLDENDAEAAAYRKAKGFQRGRAVQARLLLAGPGRQDLIDEFGLDVTVPRTASSFYPPAAHARGAATGAFNPVSVPPVLAIDGLALQNWIGSESALAPTLECLVALVGGNEREVLAMFGLPSTDRALTRRALLTDLRNLSTLAIQQDSYPGLLWADTSYGGPAVPARTLAAVPGMYAAAALRAELARSASAWAETRARGNAERIARGREIFAERIVGEVANRQILPQAPPAYADANLRGVVLAPLDPTRPLNSKVPVRCADCHSAAPLESRVPLASHPPPLGRCTHCHLAHPSQTSDDDAGEPYVPIASLSSPKPAPAEVAFCERCHTQHRDFGPLVYSSSRVFPFDADGDGLAQGDEEDDAGAGGIGTEPLIKIETPPGSPPRPRTIPVIRYVNRRDRFDFVRTGIFWVRVPPLTAISATAPYLHNGSVPTLAALLEPAKRRPTMFPVGNAGFVLDTRLPGNRNIGHEYGAALAPRDKADLIAFLNSL
jgi:hypothetical protein